MSAFSVLSIVSQLCDVNSYGGSYVRGVSDVNDPSD